MSVSSSTMSGHLVSSLVLVFLVVAASVTAAPLHPKPRQTKVSVILNDVDLTEAELADLEMPSGNTRTKRHADAGDLDLSELLDSVPEPRHHQRSRRSAAWWLHATIQLCDKHIHLCKTIELEEGNVKMQVRLETE